VFIATAAVIYCLGHGLCTFTGVPRSTQPSTLCGTVNWVIITMAMVDVDGSCQLWRTHSPSQLAWSEGWWPPGAQSAFIRWNGWTLTMTLVMMTAPLTLSWLSLLSSVLHHVNGNDTLIILESSLQARSVLSCSLEMHCLLILSVASVFFYNNIVTTFDVYCRWHIGSIIKKLYFYFALDT